MRIALQNGGWFNSDSAVKFDEDTNWDGNNHISVPTGSQWNHEALYYTKSGNWVLNRWSQYQGSIESYEQIDEDTAIDWLIQNCLEDDLSDLPNKVQQRVTESIETAEV